MYASGRNTVLEDKVYNQWIHTLPYLEDKSLYSFKTYFEKATGKNIDRRSTEEILADIEEAMRRLEDGN